MSQQAPRQQPLSRRQTQYAPSSINTQTTTLQQPGSTTQYSQNITNGPIAPFHFSTQASNPSTMAVVPAIPLQNLQNTAPSQSNTLSLSSTSSSIVVAAKRQWTEFWSATNGIGFAALVLAIVFGVGAWVGMNMQYHQGAKSLELTIWTTCADHENIRNTSLCRDVLGKSFDQFHKRAVAIPVSKRDLLLSDDELTTPLEDVVPAPASRMEALVSSLDDFERALIDHRDPDKPWEQGLNVEIRATIFPFMNLLYTPFRWVFAQIESLILFSMHLVHKMFNWISIAAWFGFQVCVYSAFETFVKAIFQGFDAAIVELMPNWVPPIFVSGLATAVGIAGLKSYWYGVAFWECIKWIFIWRVGVFVACQVLVGIWILYNAWYDRVKRRD